MSDSTWNRICTILGVGIGAVTLWKLVKYLAGATVLFWAIAIMVVVKMVTGTIVSVTEIRSRNEVERMKVKILLESKDKAIEWEHMERMKQLELSMLQEQRQAESKERLEKEQLRWTVYSVLEQKINAYGDDMYKKYNQLQKEYQAYSDRYDNDIERGQAYLQMCIIKRQLLAALPDPAVVEKGKDKIRNQVLIAYGLMQDPTIQLAIKNESKSNSNEIELIHNAPNLSLDSVFKRIENSDFQVLRNPEIDYTKQLTRQLANRQANAYTEYQSYKYSDNRTKQGDQKWRLYIAAGL
jgi:hypothetical protein